MVMLGHGFQSILPPFVKDEDLAPTCPSQDNFVLCGTGCRSLVSCGLSEIYSQKDYSIERAHIYLTASRPLSRGFHYHSTEPATSGWMASVEAPNDHVLCMY